jgi:hypothetical protein
MMAIDAASIVGKNKKSLGILSSGDLLVEN